MSDFMKIPPVEAELFRTGRRMAKLIAAFRYFANDPNK